MWGVGTRHDLEVGGGGRGHQDPPQRPRQRGQQGTRQISAKIVKNQIGIQIQTILQQSGFCLISPNIEKKSFIFGNFYSLQSLFTIFTHHFI